RRARCAAALLRVDHLPAAALGADDRRPHVGRQPPFPEKIFSGGERAAAGTKSPAHTDEVATRMDFSVSSLPVVNALLNALATILLLCGYVAIRRRKIQVHRALMLSAFVTSVLFLISYVIYHAHVGSRPFPGRGPI